MTDDTITQIDLLRKRFIHFTRPALTGDDVDLILAALNEYRNHIQRITPEY